MVLEKTLESPLDSKEIKPVNHKGNQPWIFIGRIDAEAKAPIHWPPDVKSQLIGKDCDAGKNWRQKEKGAAKNEMVGWHNLLNGHEFEQTSGDSEGFLHSSVGKESTCNAGNSGSISGSGRSAAEGISYLFQYSWASLVAQLVKNPPAMQETWVWSLGWEKSLEKGKATHSSILA